MIDVEKYRVELVTRVIRVEAISAGEPKEVLKIIVATGIF
jgi:hypothetical protein